MLALAVVAGIAFEGRRAGVAAEWPICYDYKAHHPTLFAVACVSRLKLRRATWRTGQQRAVAIAGPDTVGRLQGPSCRPSIGF